MKRFSCTMEVSLIQEASLSLLTNKLSKEESSRRLEIKTSRSPRKGGIQSNSNQSIRTICSVKEKKGWMLNGNYSHVELGLLKSFNKREVEKSELWISSIGISLLHWTKWHSLFPKVFSSFIKIINNCQVGEIHLRREIITAQ